MKSLKSKLIALMLLMTFIVIGSTGCYKMEYLDNDYAVSVVKELMAKADELNRIHYGVGLERAEGNEKESYSEVLEGEKYKSLKDIEKFTRSVLSEKYASELLKSTCDGIDARYIEVGSVDEKKLLAKKEMTVVPGISSYDLESIEIEQATKLEIKATIKRVDGTAKSLIIVSEKQDGESVWRINGPTY